MRCHARTRIRVWNSAFVAVCHHTSGRPRNHFLDSGMSRTERIKQFLEAQRPLIACSKCSLVGGELYRRICRCGSKLRCQQCLEKCGCKQNEWVKEAVLTSIGQIHSQTFFTNARKRTSNNSNEASQILHQNKPTKQPKHKNGANFFIHQPNPKTQCRFYRRGKFRNTADNCGKRNVEEILEFRHGGKSSNHSRMFHRFRLTKAAKIVRSLHLECLKERNVVCSIEIVPDHAASKKSENIICRSGGRNGSECENRGGESSENDDCKADEPNKDEWDLRLSQSSIGPINATISDLPETVIFENTTIELIENSVQTQVIVSSEDEKSQTSIPAAPVIRPIEIVTSNLTVDEMEKVMELSSALGIRVSDKVAKTTTHLITRTGVPRAYSRKLKVIQAIALHIFIVEFTWALDSLGTLTLMDERDYEMRTEIGSNFRPGAPERSRIAFSNDSSHRLLRPIRVFIAVGPRHDYSKEDLRWLAELSGARVIDDISEFLDGQGGLFMVSVCADHLRRFESSKAIFGAMFDRLSVRAIQSRWLLDSIAAYDVRAYTSYALYDEQNCSQAIGSSIRLDSATLGNLARVWQS